MTETTDVTFKPEAPKPEAPAKPAAPAAAPRALPSDEDIAAWIHGADVPTLGAVFEGIDVKRFDALVMQVRKEELVPQHWQVLSDHTAPDDMVFNQLPEVGRLRVRYKNQELSRRRLPHLRYAWMEMGGRRPNIWTVPDLLAAMRRIYDKKHPVDWTELLSAMRDIWRDSDLPFGREQLEILWACLVLIRKATKK